MLCLDTLEAKTKTPHYTLTTISSLAEAQEEFDTATKRTLFIFDIDEMLIGTNDPTLQLKKLLVDTVEILKKLENTPGTPKEFKLTIKNSIKNFPDQKSLADLKGLLPNDKRLATLLKLYPNAEPIEELKSIYKLFKNFFSNSSSLLDQILNTQQPVLLEQKSPTIIKNLKEKHAPVIALSAFQAGPFYEEKNSCQSTTQEHRFKELAELGITFSPEKMFNASYLEWFNSGKIFSRNFIFSPSNDIIFHKGIISTGSVEKGLVLKSFIECMYKKPRKVIFFDNVFENLISVAQELEKIDIPVHCYLYTAEQKLPTTKVDLTVVQKQFELIEKNREYFSYQTAQEMVQRHKQKIIKENSFSLPGSVETEESHQH